MCYCRAIKLLVPTVISINKELKQEFPFLFYLSIYFAPLAVRPPGECALLPELKSNHLEN